MRMGKHSLGYFEVGAVIPRNIHNSHKKRPQRPSSQHTSLLAGKKEQQALVHSSRRPSDAPSTARGGLATFLLPAIRHVTCSRLHSMDNSIHKPVTYTRDCFGPAGNKFKITCVVGCAPLLCCFCFCPPCFWLPVPCCHCCLVCMATGTGAARARQEARPTGGAQAQLPVAGGGPRMGMGPRAAVRAARTGYRKAIGNGRTGRTYRTRKPGPLSRTK